MKAIRITGVDGNETSSVQVPLPRFILKTTKFRHMIAQNTDVQLRLNNWVKTIHKRVELLWYQYFSEWGNPPHTTVVPFLARRTYATGGSNGIFITLWFLEACKTAEDIDRTIKHELIHVWQYRNGISDYDNWHNNFFLIKAVQIGLIPNIETSYCSTVYADLTDRPKVCHIRHFRQHWVRVNNTKQFDTKIVTYVYTKAWLNKQSLTKLRRALMLLKISGRSKLTERSVIIHALMCAKAIS